MYADMLTCVRNSSDGIKIIRYQYPAGMSVNGTLYVSYSVNKEDIALTRVALSAL